jgi:hypothetical protein
VARGGNGPARDEQDAMFGAQLDWSKDWRVKESGKHAEV